MKTIKKKKRMAMNNNNIYNYNFQRSIHHQNKILSSFYFTYIMYYNTIQRLQYYITACAFQSCRRLPVTPATANPHTHSIILFFFSAYHHRPCTYYFYHFRSATTPLGTNHSPPDAVLLTSQIT